MHGGDLLENCEADVDGDDGELEYRGLTKGDVAFEVLGNLPRWGYPPRIQRLRGGV